MKCPNCGREIPEGGLICEYCAQEIHIVPEYDTKVEETISETMSAITSDLAKDEEDSKSKEHENRGWLSANLKAFLFALAIIAAVICVLFYRTSKSSAHYYGLAYDAMDNEDYERAVQLFDKGLSLGQETEWKILLMKAECQQKSGLIEEAAGTAMQLIEASEAQETGEVSAPDQEDLMSAYGRILSCYTALEKYEDAADLMDSCTDKRIRLAYQEFMTPDISVDPESGSFEKQVNITASCPSYARIYYTLDYSTPDPEKDSILYDGPILLEAGDYQAGFTAVNPYGICSRILRRHYEVHPEKPGNPVILTESGTYTEETMIEAVIPEDGTLYYTSDGSIPTDASDVYTEPFPMPDGTSNFRFAVINSDGVSGEIAEVHYNLSVVRSLSPNDGVGCILNVMTAIGQTVDTSGTIREGNARFSYVYIGEVYVDGYGAFYLYNEFLTDTEGNSVMTGRCFAVLVPSGAVYLYDGAAGLLRL